MSDERWRSSRDAMVALGNGTLTVCNGGQLTIGITDENGDPLPEKEEPATEAYHIEVVNGEVVREQVIPLTPATDWTCLAEAALEVDQSPST